MVETGIDYIRRCRSLGFSDAEIVQALQTTGWQTSDIKTALLQASATAKPTHKRRWLWITLLSLCAALLVLAALATWWFASGQLN